MEIEKSIFFMLDSIFRHYSKTLHVFRIFDFVGGRRASKGLTGLSHLSSRGAKFLGGELLEASGLLAVVGGRRASRVFTGLSRRSSRGAKFLGGELLEASGSDTADSLIQLDAEPLDLNINLDLDFGGAGGKNPESAAAGA